MAEGKLSVLVVEDDEADYEDVLRDLTARNRAPNAPVCKVEWARTLGEALHYLTLNRVDTLLLDLSLPDTTGLSGLDQLRTAYPQLPIVVLTGLDDEEVAVQALEQGAQDYLVKGRKNSLLVRTVWHAVHRQQVVVELENAKDEALAATRAKSSFLANMSHEIRTPLTAIIGFGEALLDAEITSEEHDKAAQTVVRNGNFLLDIINDILDLAKVEADLLTVERISCSPISILQDVHNVMRLKALEKGVELKVGYIFPLPQNIQSDPLRLKQILINLIGNAIKFTDKGYVKVTLASDIATESISIEVEDTGVGIAEEYRSKIFTPFIQGDSTTTRKYGGTGLGLTISRRLAQLLGGDIGYRSAAGEGSTFQVSVDTGPIASDQVLECLPEAQSPNKSGTIDKIPSLKGRVLFVEDCPDNQELVKFLLSRTKITLETAQNGKEGSEKALSSDFDLILMDMQMPVMDGFAATRKLRSKDYQTPIVALTASAMRSKLVECLEAGCNECLTKPFERAEFYELLSRYLEKEDNNKLNSSEDSNARYDQIVHKFLSNLPARVNALQQAFEGNDLSTLAKCAHKLAGAEMFGFPEIGAIAYQLELAAEASQTGECKNLVRQLAQLTAKARKIPRPKARLH